jgi:hypothetical protein
MFIVLGVLVIVGLIWLLRRNRDSASRGRGHSPAGTLSSRRS